MHNGRVSNEPFVAPSDARRSPGQAMARLGVSDARFDGLGDGAVERPSESRRSWR